MNPVILHWKYIFFIFYSYNHVISLINIYYDCTIPVRDLSRYFDATLICDAISELFDPYQTEFVYIISLTF